MKEHLQPYQIEIMSILNSLCDNIGAIEIPEKKQKTLPMTGNREERRHGSYKDEHRVYRKRGRGQCTK